VNRRRTSTTDGYSDLTRQLIDRRDAVLRQLNGCPLPIALIALQYAFASYCAAAESLGDGIATDMAERMHAAVVEILKDPDERIAVIQQVHRPVRGSVQ
jgi:hypothetical protein